GLLHKPDAPARGQSGLVWFPSLARRACVLPNGARRRTMSDATILIVDDDEVLGQILTRVLSQQGYRVERATEAAQALRLVRDHPPQLGLLDLCLPDQDGTELARKLRGQVPNLPLILMTAYPLSLRDQPERTEGFDRVLTKPLNLQELRHAVDAALG